MRKILCLSVSLTFLLSDAVFAQQGPATVENPAILVPSNLSAFNQQGFNLPSVPRATGQDSVRGAGGISCQSSVSTNGPVFDAGFIGTNDVYARDAAALYGRITIPLGRKPKRIDCSTLYNLEVERLRLEVELLRRSAAESQALDREIAFREAQRAEKESETSEIAAEASPDSRPVNIPDSTRNTVPQAKVSNTSMTQ